MVYGIKYGPKKNVSIKESMILQSLGATVVTRSGVMQHYIDNKNEALTVLSVLDFSSRSDTYDFEIITVEKSKIDKNYIVSTAKEFFAKEKGQSFSDTIVVR